MSERGSWSLYLIPQIKLGAITSALHIAIGGVAKIEDGATSFDTDPNLLTLYSRINSVSPAPSLRPNSY